MLISTSFSLQPRQSLHISRVLAVEALGIKVKAGLCLNDGSSSEELHNSGYKGGSGSPGNKYEQGYQDDNGKGSYPGDSGGGNGGHGSNNGGGGRVPTCNGIVAKLRALGINIDANVCLGGKDGNGGSKYPPLSGGSTCPDLVADLRLLGIPVKAEVCLGGDGGNNSGGDGNRCAIGANVGVSKLLGVDLCVGGSGDNNGGYPGNGGNGNGSHPTCQDIRAKVQLLGIKVDANVCLGGKNSGPNAPVLSNKSGCPTLVANAKLLGILNIDLALCLKVNINLGLKRRSISKRILATR
ncbi:hypothetical protein K7432_014376 [Basidiobolus ranarum]|uniref:Uncharacterized protein n=1 Tax=Basidiobolus ranarum TaxID=34480 RepID=A0ABR2VPQ7_9FUNG